MRRPERSSRSPALPDHPGGTAAPQLPVELPCVRLAQQRTLLGKQIDIERCRGKLRRAQPFEPVADLFLSVIDGQWV